MLRTKNELFPSPYWSVTSALAEATLSGQSALVFTWSVNAWLLKQTRCVSKRVSAVIRDDSCFTHLFTVIYCALVHVSLGE